MIQFILILLLLPFRTLSEAEVPLAPASVDLLPLSPESIRVDFTPPSSDRGSEITSYLIEWDTDPGVREVQEVRTRSYVGANEVQEISTSIPEGSEQENGYGSYVFTDQDSNDSPYSYTITGLDTNKNYFVRVSAHTSCDDTCRKGSSDQLGCYGFSYSHASESFHAFAHFQQ